MYSCRDVSKKIMVLLETLYQNIYYSFNKYLDAKVLVETIPDTIWACATEESTLEWGFYSTGVIRQEADICAFGL